MNYQYKATLVNVVDGDTLDFDVDLGFRVTMRIRVRLNGIDTPEIFRPSCDAEATHGFGAVRFIEDNFLNKTGTLTTYKDRTGKYGRYLADFDDLVHQLEDNGFEKMEEY